MVHTLHDSGQDCQKRSRLEKNLYLVFWRFYKSALRIAVNIVAGRGNMACGTGPITSALFLWWEVVGGFEVGLLGREPKLRRNV